MQHHQAQTLARVLVAVVLSRLGRESEIAPVLTGDGMGPAVTSATARILSAANESDGSAGYIAVEKIETVTGDFGELEGAPYWRLVVEDRVADFDHPGQASNFALAVNLRLARHTGSRLGDLMLAVLDGEAPERAIGMTLSVDLDGDQDGRRRSDTRDSLMLMASISSSGGFPIGSGRVRNISSTGLMLDRCPDLDQDAEVEIDLRNIGPVAARVVWKDGDRVGMRFVSAIDIRPVLRKA